MLLANVRFINNRKFSALSYLILYLLQEHSEKNIIRSIHQQSKFKGRYTESLQSIMRPCQDVLFTNSILLPFHKTSTEISTIYLAIQRKLMINLFPIFYAIYLDNNFYIINLIYILNQLSGTCFDLWVRMMTCDRNDEVHSFIEVHSIFNDKLNYY